ncbi:hypothetical protein D3C76_1780870 [compost metagenome]
MLVTKVADLLVVLAQQHVHQMPDAIALAGTENRRQGLAGRFGGVPGFHAIDAVVAMTARLGHVFVKIG